jgi:predicted  nucleic acid-binding Zn-ribbon protein
MLNKLKDDILRLLKEDEEFRYAVVGLLGLQRLEEAIARLIDIQVNMEARLKNVEEAVAKLSEDILSKLVDNVTRLADNVIKLADRVAMLVDTISSMESRLAKVEEAVVRLADIQARQEERLAKVEDRLSKVEEAWIRSEERLAKVEERLTRVEERLEEHDKKFYEVIEELKVHRAKLEEHDRKFNEIIAEIRDLRRVSNEHTVMLRNMQGMMIHGFAQMGKFAGISLESLVRSILTNVMIDNGELPKDKEITNITIDGEEIDIFCDDPLIVGEVTSYADSIDEVSKLIKKVKLVRDRFNKEPKHVLLIITNIKRDVYDDMLREAESNGIEVIIGKRV